MDNMKKTFGDLEVYKEIEIEKKDIQQICMKKPVFPAGYISFVTNEREVITVNIDHKNVYEPARHLILKFSPKKIRIG